MTEDEDYDALSQKHLASIKRDTRVSLEDATVRATHKVMAEFNPEQEQECVAVINVLGNDWRIEYLSLPVGKHRLYAQQYTYTSPPKRKEWVGLTGDDMDDITSTAMDKADAMLLTEAKLKEKNT